MQQAIREGIKKVDDSNGASLLRHISFDKFFLVIDLQYGTPGSFDIFPRMVYTNGKSSSIPVCCLISIGPAFDHKINV